ncbi:MAG TPA: hypothetical protein VLE53_18705 [Gemmatimonadaceae bacterium]|nr:hypothetical protein [Gemmatimonadaceae bacterium]
MDILFSVAMPLVPMTALWMALRHGPWRSRFWRHENPIGFALFVGGIAFLAGFVGPMILAPGANQGPLLGIFYTGPLGTIGGLLWGMVRAWRRSAAGT